MWARLLGEYRAWNRARLARKRHAIETAAPKLIITVTSWIRVDGGIYPSWIHCYENPIGERSCRYQKGQIEIKLEHLKQYNTVIVPWMNHRYTNQQLIEWAKDSHSKPA